MAQRIDKACGVSLGYEGLGLGLGASRRSCFEYLFGQRVSEL